LLFLALQTHCYEKHGRRRCYRKEAVSEDETSNSGLGTVDADDSTFELAQQVLTSVSPPGSPPSERRTVELSAGQNCD
jgi:hypothetical protein